MSSRVYKNALKIYGNPEKVKKLTENQLKCLQSVCNGLRKALMENCMSHALYRCNVSSRDSLIFLILSGADYDGNMKELQVGYDIETSKFYTYKIEIDDEELVGQEIYNMLIKLTEYIPTTVGMLDFPLEGSFKEGFMSEYSKEPGTVLFDIKDSLNHAFFTED